MGPPGTLEVTDTVLPMSRVLGVAANDPYLGYSSQSDSLTWAARTVVRSSDRSYCTSCRGFAFESRTESFGVRNQNSISLSRDLPFTDSQSRVDS